MTHLRFHCSFLDKKLAIFTIDVNSGNGGFHSYRTSPQPTPVHSHATGMSRGLPAHLNQAIAVNAKDSECTIREQDHFMPTENVVRIMLRILPSHAKISDDSKVAIQECITEFISFVTGEANDRCQCEQRKTITDEDFLWAMNKLGFDDYIEPLGLYLHSYRGLDGGVRGSLKGEPLVLKRPMVDPASGCNIMSYNLPPNFPIAHPPPMRCYMEGDASNGSTSQCAVLLWIVKLSHLRRRVRSDQFIC